MSLGMHNHSFNIFFAQKYGMDEAVFIQTLVFWTASNAAKGPEDNEHFQQERYWSYGTPEYFVRFFPYWKPRRIKDILSSCIVQNLIIKGSFNKKGYDRTAWYSLSDNALYELNLDITCMKPAPDLIRRNSSNPLDGIRPIHCTDSVSPIPITKPITKPITSFGLSEKAEIKSKGVMHNMQGCDYTERPNLVYNESDGQSKINEQPDKQGNQTQNENLPNQATEKKGDLEKSDYFDNQIKNLTDNTGNSLKDSKKQKNVKNPDDDPLFLKFYSQYPVKKKKRQAYVMWCRLNPDASLANQLIDDVQNRMLNDSEWMEGYIPHPATYLNPENRRWEDDVVNKDKIKHDATVRKQKIAAEENEKRINAQQEISRKRAEMDRQNAINKQEDGRTLKDIQKKIPEGLALLKNSVGIRNGNFDERRV